MVFLPQKYQMPYPKIAQDILAQGKSYAAVCSALNIGRQTMYDWRDKYPKFAEALAIGMQKSQEYWEAKGEAGVDGDIKNFGAGTYALTVKSRFREDYANLDKDAESDKKDEMIYTLIDKLSE